jgi:hypothetical protein
MKMNNDIKTYLSSIGAKGGKQKSDKKTIANRMNAKKRWDEFYKRSGIKKLA